MTDRNPGRTLALAATRPPRQTSPHLLIPGQLELFPAVRHWGRVAGLPFPELTPTAVDLLQRLKEEAQERNWPYHTLYEVERTLRLALAWLGADAPIPEADIRAIYEQTPMTTAKRTLQFLKAHGRLIPEVTGPCTDERAVRIAVNALPDGVGDEVQRWVQVLRGQGRRRHHSLRWVTIRRYLWSLQPFLLNWSRQVDSLREITTEQIRSTLRTLHGHDAHSVASALRSLFRALKQEKIIFADPTKGIRVPDVVRSPRPLPSDQLRNLLTETGEPLTRLVIALIAVHAITRHEVRHLRMEDLDLPRGRITLRRDGRSHIRRLEPLTYGLVRAWLAERAKRWPRTLNPHLLLTVRTASDDRHPPISTKAISYRLRRLNVSANQLRADRILYEAYETADPVHLVRVFGISVETAKRYVRAAHPERQATIPR
ncbi:site-specific integrase [Micromonospora saelicesensis]|uniref:site-specific integrase n=1 Tax=Micromonospora saelicesensis TaxID=285676 RepID=UPI0011BFD0AE|nr:site-specific integrase [Micromonospora saelicesensis]